MNKFRMCLLCILGISTVAFSVIDVAAIHLDVEALTWFHAGSPSQFAFVNDWDSTEIIIDQGDLRSALSLEYDYAFDGIITITPCDLLMNGSSGGRAAGLFDIESVSNGASIMTITINRMWNVNTGIDVINSPSGVVLLSAQMDASAGYWIISETSTYSDFFTGTTHYQITGGEVAQADIVRMSGFQAVYQFPECGPISNITNMLSDIDCGEPAIVLTADSVPEPATLLLLVLGSVILRKKN